MKQIILFSGTTEGRVLSSLLSGAKCRHFVCVASDYGRSMMGEDPMAQICVGRMDHQQMLDFLKENAADQDSILVDATHPYATEVTGNIKKTARAAGLTYIRVKREESAELTEVAKCYENIESCAAALDQTEGNILLTTGSKELAAFFQNVSSDTAERTYVRILPAEESLKLCNKQNVDPSRIIAMQGPFTREMNEAIIRQYGIRHLVTKESGSAGGFEQKLAAARNTGIAVHVIARPDQDEGVSVEEAFSAITGKTIPAEYREDDLSEGREIFLIGMGMGDPSYLTGKAAAALETSDAIFGAKRLIKNLPCPNKYEMYLSGDIIPVLEREPIRKAAIVFSGDTGFYSGAKAMLKAIREWDPKAKVSQLCGISSISYLSAKCGISYDDACLMSIHGKKAQGDRKALIEAVKYNSKVFSLLSDQSDAFLIAKLLSGEGIRGKMILGKNLSYDRESIETYDIEEFVREAGETADESGAALQDQGKNIVTALLLNESPVGKPLIPVKRDEDFIREKVPMTKETVRHESLIRLNLHRGDLLYDIGGGTGSVAIEAGGLDQGLSVVTIEKKEEAAALIRKNIQRAGLLNVSVMKGDAAETLPGLSRPDCVFIGGSGGKLFEIINILHEKGEGIRFVINAVSMETVEEVRKIMASFPVKQEEAVLLSVSNLEKIGGHHLMKAQNPVWIFSFTL
ncbi:MAG: precorrin-6A reductase [Lachnospiraceae bacterium]|nr:precorrin-6A reductase [Lachnospiraceae bacterium]